MAGCTSRVHNCLRGAAACASFTIASPSDDFAAAQVFVAGIGIIVLAARPHKKRRAHNRKNKKKKSVLSIDNRSIETSSENSDEHHNTVISQIRVILLGLSLLLIGTVGFYFIPGMIADGAQGSKLVNAFYCASVTIMT